MRLISVDVARPAHGESARSRPGFGRVAKVRLVSIVSAVALVASAIVGLGLGGVTATAAEQPSRNLFTERFEAGPSAWHGNGGLIVVTDPGSADSPNARVVMAGQPAYGTRTVLSTTRLSLGVDLRVNSLGGSSAVNFVKFRTPTGLAIAEIYLTASGALGVRNDVQGRSTTSSLLVRPDEWHHLELALHVAGPSSSLRVSLDGVTPPTLDIITDLGSTGIGEVQLGENLTGKTADLSFDNVTADRLPPRAPEGLMVTPEGLDVRLSWRASADPEVSTYRILRNGSTVENLDMRWLTWLDTSTSPTTSYRYQIAAVDVRGDVSAASDHVTVTTPDAQTSFVWPVAADAYVDAANGTTNFGDRTYVRVDSTPEQRTYLRFHVAGIGTRAPSDIALRVRAASSLAAGFQVRLLPEGGWSESELTFANAPTPGALLATSGPAAAGSWVEVPIPGMVKGDGTYDLVLMPRSTTALRLDARESGAPAEIVADINASGSNASPVAGDMALATDEQVATSWVPAVFDADSATLTCSIESRTHGWVTVAPDCSSGTYEPWDHLNGRDVFVYRVGDGNRSATGTVTVTVRRVQDAPTTRGSATGVWSAARSTTVALSAEDQDGTCPLTLEVTPPAHGSVTHITAPRCDYDVPSDPSWTTGYVRRAWMAVEVTYTPDDDWVGPDHLEFTVRDPDGLSATSSVTIDVPAASQTFAVSASADAWVDAANPTLSHGSGYYLPLDGSPRREAYVRFPVSGLGAAAPAKLTLRMRASSSLSAGFAVHSATGEWTESTLTWANAPGAGRRLATSGPAVSGQWLEIALPVDALPGDGDLNIVLVPLSNTQMNLLSREWGPTVTLVVTR